MTSSAGTEVLAKSKDEIARWIADRLASELGVPSDAVDMTVPFAALGVSSILGVSLAGDLAEELSFDVPATLFWDYPTIEKLAEHLAQLPPRPHQAA